MSGPSGWQPGDVVADLYEVRDVLRSGGMGLVYRVRHRGWNMELAVKVPRPELLGRPEAVADFEAEAESWVGLGLHPHTVNCVYVRRIDGFPIVFAEWVDGGNLAEWVGDRRLYRGGPRAALARILDVAIQFAWGLDHAHEHRLVHQDVKPANVMLTMEGTVKVTDFGLAKARAAAGEATQGPEGASVQVGYGGMTQAYCSPEQAMAAAGGTRVMLTRATDVWSWAVSVLELFTGGPPCAHGQAAAEVFEARLAEGPQAGDIPAIPFEVAEVLRRCLAFAPRDRPARMAELAEHLVELYAQLAGAPYPRSRPATVRLLADGLNNQALSMLDLGQVERAEQQWDQALAADPHNPHAVYNRGLHRWRHGHITDQQLVAELEAVLASHPSDWVDEHLLALVHLERGDVERARQLLEECARRAPDDPDIATALRSARRLPTPKSPVILEGNTKNVLCVALSEDGRLALTGGDAVSYNDGTVRMWQTASGRCERVFKRGGYDYGVQAVAMSADGRVVLSVHCGGWGVRVWDGATGRLTGVLGVPGAESVAVTADGSVALVCARDGPVTAWDVAAARRLRTMEDSVVGRREGRLVSIGQVAVQPEGGLAVGLKGGGARVRVWEVATGRLVHTREHSTSRFTLSPDGRLVLNSDRDGTIRLWEVATGRELRAVTAHRDWGWWVAVDNEGGLAVSGGRDGAVRVWELDTGRCRRTLTGHPSSVEAVTLSGDGSLVLSGSTDRTARLWWVPAAGPAAPWSYPRPSAAAELTAAADVVAAAVDRADWLIAGGDVSIAAEELRSARAVSGHQHHPALVRRWRQLGHHGRRTTLAGAWPLLEVAGWGPWRDSPDGMIALAAEYGAGELRVWDLDSGALRHELDGHEGHVLGMALSSDGTVGYSASEDGVLRRWDLRTGRCTREVGTDGYSLFHQVVISGHGLALVHRQGNAMEVYDLERGALRWTFHSPPPAGRQIYVWFHGVWLSDDDQLALTASEGDWVQVWDLRTGECRHTFNTGGGDEIRQIASDDRASLVFASNADGVRVWDVATGRQGPLMKNRSKWANVPYVVVVPDATQLLTYRGDDVAHLWDVSTGRCLRSLEGHAGLVQSAAFSRDGTVAVTGGQDGTIRVWNVVDGTCLSVMEGHTDGFTSVSLSADAHRVVSCSYDGTMRVWELDWEYDFAPSPPAPVLAPATAGRDRGRRTRLFGRP